MDAGGRGAGSERGLIFLLVLCLSPASLRQDARQVIAGGAASPVLWHASCRHGVYDYRRSGGGFRAGRWRWGRRLLAFTELWRYGFVYPLAGCAAVLALVAVGGIPIAAVAVAGLALALLAVLAFAAIYAQRGPISAAPAQQSSESFWIPAILLRELAAAQDQQFSI